MLLICARVVSMRATLMRSNTAVPTRPINRAMITTTAMISINEKPRWRRRSRGRRCGWGSMGFSFGPHWIELVSSSRGIIVDKVMTRTTPTMSMIRIGSSRAVIRVTEFSTCSS